MFPSNKLHLSCPGHADLVYADTNTAAAKALLLTDLGLAGFEPGDSGSSAEPDTIQLVVTQGKTSEREQEKHFLPAAPGYALMFHNDGCYTHPGHHQAVGLHIAIISFIFYRHQN